MEPHMRYRLGLKSWATGALVLAAVSGCAGSNSPTADPTTSSIPSTSSPTTSASPTSPSEAASSAASQKLRAYFATVDRLGQDATAALVPLDQVATSTQLSAERRLLKSQHGRGERQVGATRVAQLKVQSVNLDNSDPSAGKVPTVVIDVCWDVSKVDVLNKGGMSIVSANRPDTGWTRYIVANYRYAANPSGGWRVASGQDLKRTPCAAS
jgi:hypothetical protein